MSLDVETHHHAHGHKTGRPWVDMVVAFSALFISLVSLGVAILHGRTMENMAEANARLVSANSWPYLSSSVGVETVKGGPQIHMRVYNTGVGPAKIETAELKWKGVPYRTQIDFLRACCNASPSFTDFDSTILMDEVMRAGDNFGYILLKRSANPTLYEALHRAVLSPDFQLIVCYCSIFDECWKDDLARLSLKPPRVASCDMPKVPFDQGLSLAKPS